MLKKILIMTSLFILMFNGFAFAQIFQKTGSVFISSLSYDAGLDVYKVDLDPNLLAAGSVKHRLYSDSGYTNQTFQSQVYFPATMTYAYATYNCKKYYWDTFYDANGNVIGELKFYPDNLVNSSCTTNYTPTPSTTPPSGSGSSCTDCGLFNCPGWEAHMQALEDIKNAIPPAPNWQKVSEILQRYNNSKNKERFARNTRRGR